MNDSATHDLPRQNSANGRIKDYEISVSQDGKSWGSPIHRGAFANRSSLQRVMFASPVRARYIRFTALSPQTSDHDFATGADFTVLVK